MTATTFSAVSDAELARMTSLAFREAARCWQEARQEPNRSPAKPLLLIGAEAAEAYWADLRDEAERRLDLLAEDASRTDVPSADDRPFVTGASAVRR